MAALVDPVQAARDPAPELRFTVEGSKPLDYAAVPTLSFALRIATGAEVAIRSVLLDVQVQIAARRRDYDESAREQLLDLFGAPERWGTTLRTLAWTRTTVVVPPFTGTATVELLLPCTYDLEVGAARYLAALHDGEVPVELLFSGSVFYTSAPGLLQATRIPLNQSVDYRMPVAVWRETMDRHFPNCAWLRLGRSGFERLCAYRARQGLESWDAVVARLLEEAG